MTKILKQLLGTALAVCLFATLAVAEDRYENIHIANGLATADVGDWVLFKLPDGKTQKHTVIEKNGTGKEATAVVQIVDFQGTVPTFSRKVTSPAGEEFMQPPMPEGKKYTFERSKETIDFDDSEVEVTIVDVFDKDKKVRSWYLSTDIPVYGTMKRVDANGNPEFSLVTSGTAVDAKDAKTDPYVFPAAKKTN
jgi:hypothetical protein